MWNGGQDEASLVTELLAALRTEKRQTIALEPVGGAVPLDSHFYIVRTTDAAFSAAIERRDSTVLVKGARQIGKTSLLTRALQQARSAGARCIRTDLQKLTVTELADQESFFHSLAYMVADQLEMDNEPQWRGGRSGAANFERFLTKEALGASEGPVVWALDEVDRLFTCSFGA